jgi:hypothetical protein
LEPLTANSVRKPPSKTSSAAGPPRRPAERANFQSFCNELCDLLAVPRPDPARQDERDNAYVYDKTVWFDDGDGKRTANFIDLYKRGCFAIEAEQGHEADDGGPNLFDLTAASRGKQRRGTAVRGTVQWDAAMKEARGQALRYIHEPPTGPLLSLRSNMKKKSPKRRSPSGRIQKRPGFSDRLVEIAAEDLPAGAQPIRHRLVV